MLLLLLLIMFASSWRHQCLHIVRHLWLCKCFGFRGIWPPVLRPVLDHLPHLFDYQVVEWYVGEVVTRTAGFEPRQVPE